MEDPRLESSESGEYIKGRSDRSLDEVMFDPDETIENQGDFETSEAIESDFVDLMDASALYLGESLDVDPQDRVDPDSTEVGNDQGSSPEREEGSSAMEVGD